MVEQPGARNERRASSRPPGTHPLGQCVDRPGVDDARWRSLLDHRRVPVVEQPGARNERRASSRPRNPPTRPMCRPAGSRRRSLALAARPPAGSGGRAARSEERATGVVETPEPTHSADVSTGRVSTTLAGARCSTTGGFRWSSSPERGTSDGRRRDPGTHPLRRCAGVVCVNPVSSQVWSHGRSHPRYRRHAPGRPGRQAAKATVGEAFPVSATVFREGHDQLGAEVVLTAPGRQPPPTGPDAPARQPRRPARGVGDARPPGRVDVRGAGLVRPARDLAARRRASRSRPASTSS